MTDHAHFTVWYVISRLALLVLAMIKCEFLWFTISKI